MLASPRDYLVIDSGAQRVELSRLGTPAERREAVTAIMNELGMSEAEVVAGRKIPDRWEEIVTPEGERALVPNVATRRTQARVATVVAMGAAAVTFLIARGVVRDPRLIAPSLMALAVAIAFAIGAVWLARGGWEWRIGASRLTLRKRFGANVRDVFEARRLLLDSSSDSDGDVWYALYALGDAQNAPPPSKIVWRSTAAPKNSKTVARLMNDASTMRDLAAWLERETGLALEERTTPEAQAATLANLREALANSGRFGRMAAKLVDRLAERRTGSG
jgi:hypothetical protein